MTSILDIDQTISSGTKELYDRLYWKYHAVANSFDGTDLIAGRINPYLKINSIRQGIKLFRYFACLTTMQRFGWNFLDETWIIPDWIEFKVNVSAYQKKYGYKPIVKLYHDQYNKIVFDNGTKSKEFENCIVVIEKVFNVNRVN